MQETFQGTASAPINAVEYMIRMKPTKSIRLGYLGHYLKFTREHESIRVDTSVSDFDITVVLHIQFINDQCYRMYKYIPTNCVIKDSDLINITYVYLCTINICDKWNWSSDLCSINFKIYKGELCSSESVVDILQYPIKMCDYITSGTSQNDKNLSKLITFKRKKIRYNKNK